MSMGFLLKKLATGMVLPPFNLLLLAILGLLIVKRGPRHYLDLGGAYSVARNARGVRPAAAFHKRCVTV